MPRRTQPLAGQLDLFDQPADRPCMWHRDREATHRIVIAVDLMHPRWWENGRRLQGWGSSSGFVPDPVPLRLHTVGADHCADCAGKEPPDWLLDHGSVFHYIPRPADTEPGRTP